MHVIATAGHVDHGKSTLVKALTGSDPDRLDEEHRRGLSIQLGYCWTSLPPVGDVAFVDVPGHERFISTMLSGIGPVPAVLFVVAADDPWMPQAAEHLAALDALGVSHGVLAVTRSDLADPAPVRERAVAELSRTTLRDSPVVTVSGRTGHGLDELRSHLVDLVKSLPDPDPAADVRLWLDRAFTVQGAGTVVTGTLPAGRIRVGDTLWLDDQSVRVRGLQSLGRATDSVTGVARVALNVTGGDLGALDRHSVLVAPDAWHVTDVLDVRLTTPGAAGRVVETTGSARDGGPTHATPPERPLLHVGAAAVTAHCRPLSEDLVRLTCERPLPLRVGDRALLRDPGSRTVWGVTVLDPAPPPLRRRGAARQRALDLSGLDGAPDVASEVSRRGLVRLSLLQRIGVPTCDVDRVGVVADGWVVAADRAMAARSAMERLVAEHDRAVPLEPGVPLAVVARQLDLPTPGVVDALVSPPLRVEAGRVTTGRAAVLPERLEAALAALAEDLEGTPFAAPTAGRLRELELDHRSVAAAARAGRLLRLADGIVLLPGADQTAVAWLAELPQPFTTSEARVRLGTSRRVVLPLLDLLDKRGLTHRLPDDRRRVERG